MNSEKIYVIKVTGIRIPLIYHYGIYVEKNNEKIVYNCVFGEKNDDGGCIIETPFDEFINGRKVLNYFKTELTEKEVLEKISEINKKKWLGLFFNCSDFTRRITKISPFYTQKNYLIAAIGLVGILILLNYKK
jgi:hypothetical protein